MYSDNDKNSLLCIYELSAFRNQYVLSYERVINNALMTTIGYFLLFG